MTTIGDVVSRLRGQIKGEYQDAFLTDRFLYSVLKKYAQLLMRRQDSANKLMKFNSVWQSLPFIELIDVDKVEACCTGIQSGCTIKRSKNKFQSLRRNSSNHFINSKAVKIKFCLATHRPKSCHVSL